MTAEPGAVLHRCAVLGSPVAHSLSPALHGAAYAELGLTGWTYGRFEVGVDELGAFVDGLDATWRGLSLTMPLKAAVLDLGEVSDVARLTGSGNTLLLDGPVRQVHNTDVPGLVWAVRQATAETLETVTVLGSGATARSALAAAPDLGARRVHVLARDPARATALRPLADEVGVELVVVDWDAAPPAADLLVSTVTAGALGGRRASVLAGSAALVLDVVYDPWPTVLARAAEDAGVRTVDGLDLLVGQAVLQVELMTGRRPAPWTLRTAGEAALARRQARDAAGGPAQDATVGLRPA